MRWWAAFLGIGLLVVGGPVTVVIMWLFVMTYWIRLARDSWHHIGGRHRWAGNHRSLYGRTDVYRPAASYRGVNRRIGPTHRLAS